MHSTSSGPTAECDRPVFTNPGDREMLGHLRALAVKKGQPYTVYRDVQSGSTTSYGRDFGPPEADEWHAGRHMIPVVTILPIPVPTG